MTPRAIARYAAHSAASGVLGWVALMAIFEGAYLVGAYVEQWRRGR